VPDLACLQGPLPLVMAHRGFDLTGLENSMRAFEAAVRLGVDFLETDVRVTADDVLVAFHDARLDRVTDQSGKIAELPWRQVRQARIGGVEPIPRLEEVLAAWPGVRVNVDLKVDGAVIPFVEVIRRSTARGRVCVASFDDRRREAAVRALRRDGPVAWSPGVRRIGRLVLAARARAAAAVAMALGGAPCVQVPEAVSGVRLVTDRFVEAVHRTGAQVHVWTVDEVTAMHRLLDLGVDGIVTNRADLALQVVRTRRG
jgi:glycerophosphoryl diester phosphodiesterase